jgi:phage/plasmid-associated DNA primase
MIEAFPSAYLNKLLIIVFVSTTKSTLISAKSRLRSTYRTRKEIDSDLNIINLKNGLYNFQTGEFKEHSPNYISVNQLPIRYDAKAKPKLFGQFLH